MNPGGLFHFATSLILCGTNPFTPVFIQSKLRKNLIKK